MLLEEGKDFIFVDSDDKLITGIKIISGEYAGVLYHYLKVRVVEEKDVGKLEFGYTIIDPGDKDVDDLTKDSEFHIIMGELLTQFLLLKIQEDEQIRKINSQKSSLQ
jgi:hypothetical protein